MKRLLPLFLAVFLFTACQKQISNENMQGLQRQAGNVEAAEGDNKIDICHNGHTISINYSAWPSHQAHGDVMGACIESVSICGKEWMLRNLDVSTYRNGDPIPEVSDPSEWVGLTTGAWCWYENKSANGRTYGKLYNWFAVTDPRGLAPSGWHVPSDDEWATLITCLGGDEVAGSALKETGTAHWLSPNSDATNSSGFTALAGGFRNFYGDFILFGEYGSFWTATENGPDHAWNRSPYFDNGFVRRDSDPKQIGLSVRCVRD